MKRLRRAPEPTSAMEPWLQKAVDAKLLIEKNTRVRSSDGSKRTKAVAVVLEVDRVRRLEHVPPLLRARLTPSRHTSRCAHGLRCSGSAGCRGPGPQRVPVMALGRSALRAVHYRSCGMRLSRSPCARGCGVASE